MDMPRTGIDFGHSDVNKRANCVMAQEIGARLRLCFCIIDLCECILDADEHICSYLRGGYGNVLAFGPHCKPNGKVPPQRREGMTIAVEQFREIAVEVMLRMHYSDALPESFDDMKPERADAS